MYRFFQKPLPNAAFMGYQRTIFFPERSNSYWCLCLGCCSLRNLFPPLTTVLLFCSNRLRPVSSHFTPFGCNFRGTDFLSVLHKITSLFATQLFLRLNSVPSCPLRTASCLCLASFPCCFSIWKNAGVFALIQRKHQCDISAPFTEKLGLATQCVFN